MNKKKGVAIVSAVVIMSLVVIFTTLLFSLIMGFSINSRQSDLHLREKSFINKVCLDFIDDGEVDEYDGYFFLVRTNEDNVNQKALVCSKYSAIKHDNIFFYCIYDFGENKFLAVQRYNQFITEKEEAGQTVYYLADLIKL